MPHHLVQIYAEEKVKSWASDDRVLMRLLRAWLMTSIGQTVGKHNVRRSVLLNWPGVAAVVGEDRLRRRVAEISRSWVETEFDADTVEAFTQALYFAEHPKEAARAVRRWPGADDGLNGDPETSDGVD